MKEEKKAQNLRIVFGVLTAIAQAMCQPAISPYINITRKKFEDIKLSSNKLKKPYYNLIDTIPGKILISDDFFYYNKKNTNIYNTKNLTHIKQITTSDCEKYSDHCIFAGQGGSEVYKRDPSGERFEQVGYFWASNQSTYFGNPAEFVMVTSVAFLQFTDYFLAAESVETGIFRWSVQSNLSYSVADMGFEDLDRDFSSVESLLHVPYTQFFLNSFSRNARLSAIDFSRMEKLRTWQKEISFGFNFHLAYYDKDPSSGWVLASRYSMVEIHNYIGGRYVKEIPVKSPTYMTVVVPESDYFFAVTPHEFALYNMSAVYTGDYIWTQSEEVNGVYWDDYSNQLVFSDQVYNLIGYSFRFDGTIKIPDPVPYDWEYLDRRKFCHPNCEDCLSLIGRSGCMSNKCLPGTTVYVDSDITLPDPTGINLPFASTGSLPGGIKAKGCYLKPYPDPPGQKFMFSDSEIPALTSPVIQIIVNKSKPKESDLDLPSNQNLYTKNSTVPAPESATSQPHWSQMLIVMLVLLAVSFLIGYLIFYVCVESQGEREKRQNMKIWGLNRWLTSIKKNIKDLKGGKDFEREMEMKIQSKEEIDKLESSPKEGEDFKRKIQRGTSAHYFSFGRGRTPMSNKYPKRSRTGIDNDRMRRENQPVGSGINNVRVGNRNNEMKKRSQKSMVYNRNDESLYQNIKRHDNSSPDVIEHRLEKPKRIARRNSNPYLFPQINDPRGASLGGKFKGEHRPRKPKRKPKIHSQLD